MTLRAFFLPAGVVLFGLALLLLVGASPASNGRQEIQSAIDRFVRAYNEGNVEQLMEIYAEDFVDMSDGEATLHGRHAREETEARLRDTFAKFQGKLAVTVDEIQAFDDWGFDRGTFRLELQPKGSGPAIVVERRFLEIWGRDAQGKWRVAMAMDNRATQKARGALDRPCTDALRPADPVPAIPSTHHSGIHR